MGKTHLRRRGPWTISTPLLVFPKIRIATLISGLFECAAYASCVRCAILRPNQMKDTASFTNKKDPKNLPAYSLFEACRYLQIPEATLKSWVVGRHYPTSSGSRFFRPLIVPASKDRQVGLSFLNLIEAHVLDAIRRTHGVKLPKVRQAMDYIRRELHSQHPLAEKDFETDGVDLFIRHYGNLVNASRDGQMAIKEIIEAYLARIERDAFGVAARLYPFTRNRAASPTVKTEPRTVLIDPRISYGRPVLAGTGIPTAALAERYKAGDSIKNLSDDYSLSTDEVEEAIRCELWTEAA